MKHRFTMGLAWMLPVILILVAAHGFIFYRIASRLTLILGPGTYCCSAGEASWAFWRYLRNVASTITAAKRPIINLHEHSSIRDRFGTDARQ